MGAEAGAKARVMSFSRRLLGRWAPGSAPPWAGSRRMTVRGMGCCADALGMRVLAERARQCGDLSGAEGQGILVDCKRGVVVGRE